MVTNFFIYYNSLNNSHIVKMIKHLIFDFDGTLANTIDKLYQYIDEFGAKIGWESLEIDDIKKIRDFDIIELLTKVKVSPLFMLRIKRRLKKELSDIEIYPTLPEVLKRLKNEGYFLSIISSNNLGTINKFLKDKEIESYFDSVVSEPDLQAKSRRIKSFIKRTKINKDEVLYIGDEVRDVKAAKKAEVKSCSVTWGFNSRKRLVEEQPDFIIDTPDELFEILKSKEYNSIKQSGQLKA